MRIRNHTLDSTEIDELKGRIDRIDLEPIKFKLVKEYGWRLVDADWVEPLYKNFLLLNALHEKVVPTEAIDEMWHAHILDTRKYFQDCEEVFGEYVHHFPYFGIRGEADAKDLQQSFERTKELFASLGLDVVSQSIFSTVTSTSPGMEGNSAMCGDGGGGGGCNGCNSPASLAHARPGRKELLTLGDSAMCGDGGGGNGCNGCNSPTLYNSPDSVSRPTREDSLRLQ